MIARNNGFSFMPAIFSHTGQIHQSFVDLIDNQIKLKMQFADPQVQQGKIQSVVRYWVRQLSVVINRTASRSILAAAANLVNRENNFCQTVILTSNQCDNQFESM